MLVYQDLLTGNSKTLSFFVSFFWNSFDDLGSVFYTVIDYFCCWFVCFYNLVIGICCFNFVLLSLDDKRYWEFIIIIIIIIIMSYWVRFI